MAQSYESHPQNEVQMLLPVSGHREYSRLRFHLRRKKLQTARLGGKRAPRVVAFLRLIRDQMRRKCVMRVRCACMVKKLNQLLGGGGSFDAFQKRLLMEISFAIPVLGASLPP